MKVLAALVVATATALGGATHSARQERTLAAALRAMQARGGLAYLAHHGRRVVIVAASQEAQWKGYVAASVYAAHGYPLHSVRLVRPKPPGDVTLRFPAANCACFYRGMNRLAKVRPASRRQVIRAIEGAANRAGAHVNRIELLHPLAYAPIVVVTPHNPKDFLRQGKAALLFDRLQRRIEGGYVFVRGGDGRLVASGGYTGRSYTSFGEVGWATAV